MKLTPPLTRLHALIGLSLLTTTVFAGLRFTFLLDAVHQQASRPAIGLLGALVSFFPMLLSLRVGRRIDLHGPRKPMLTACVSLTLCAVAGWASHAFAPGSLIVLFGMAIFSGMASNTWLIAHQQMVGAFAQPGKLANAYSLSALGFGITAFTSPVLSGFSIQHLGFQGTYAWMALCPLASFIVIGRRYMPLPEGSLKRAGKPTRSILQSTLQLLQSAELRDVYIVSALFEASWTLFGFLTPIHGVQLGLSSSTIGLITGSIAITLIAMRLFLPALIRRVPPWRLLIVALAVLCMGYLGFSLSTTVPLLVAFALVLGVGQAMGAPLVNSLLYERAPSGRGAEAVGLRSTLSNGSQTVLPLVSGALGAAIGIAPAFWLLSGVLLAGMLKLRRHWHRRPALAEAAGPAGA